MAADFESLGLSGWILKQLSAIGVTRPTPIQSGCIPAILGGRDCVGVAHTGSGKTMAFALPLLHELSRDPYGIFALVLTPTRELALQIADQFRTIGKKINARDCLIVGGKDMVAQGKELARRPHVVIATPGRLADHLGSCDTFDLRRIKYLVLDEADRMLDGSFDAQLATIMSALPKKRRTLLFTATISDAVKTYHNETMNDPHIHDKTESSTATVEKLAQHYVLTPVEARDGYLFHVVDSLRKKNPAGLMIVFVRTVKECEVLSLTLAELGLENVCLHSNKTTKEREASLAKFRSAQAKILVGTDVASRGLDIPEVEYVVNHNVPQAPRNYVHRVGRTARAGRGGTAVTLVTPHDVNLIQAIEERTGVKMSELEGVDDDYVAEILTQVNVSRREVEITLSERDFEERRRINKRKKLLAKGIDPDKEEERLERVRKRKKRPIKP